MTFNIAPDSGINNQSCYTVKKNNQVDEDDLPVPQKKDPEALKNKVLAILSRPSSPVNSRELVQRATYGKPNPLYTFDSVDFLTKMK